MTRLLLVLVLVLVLPPTSQVPPGPPSTHWHLDVVSLADHVELAVEPNA